MLVGPSLGVGWVSTGLAQPKSAFQGRGSWVLQAAVLPWQRRSRPPSSSGHGTWATLSRAGDTPPVSRYPTVGRCLNGVDVPEEGTVDVILTHPHNALPVLSRVIVK